MLPAKNKKSMSGVWMSTVPSVLVLSLPHVSHAVTIAELQAQLQSLLTQVTALQAQLPQSGAAACPNLNRNLSFGSRGNDVVQLQQFLISQNFLGAGNNTGYFGRLTEATVKKFQCRENIVCSGSPSTNGYGAVGPRTRAKIVLACNVAAQTKPESPAPVSPPPAPTSPPISIPAPLLPAPNPAPLTPTPTPIIPTPTPPPSPVPASCAQLQSQTQTLTCPTGQTGSITQTRTNTCPGPTWSAWSTTSNTCTITRATFLEIVATAFAHMKNKFWIGGRDTGHIAPTTNGIPNPPPTDRPKGDLWQAATYLNVLYTDYKHRNNEEAKEMIASEWRHIRATFSDAELTTCGLPNTTQMWGIDDAGWISKMLLQIYDVTNDQISLNLAKEIVRCSQRVWWDETWGGGYWYSDVHSEGKSLIQIRLALNALEIYEKTGEVEFLHMFQFSYSWMERNLLRHDGLYWMDFRDGVVYGIGAPPHVCFQ